MPVSYPTTFLRSDSVFVDPLANNLIGPNGAPLPVAQGGTGDSGTAWTAYTPVVTATSGTITTLGAVSGRYKTLGKTVFVQMDITITTNGTGTGAVVATLPVTSVFFYIVCGREAALLGKMLQGIINANTVSIFNADNTYPGSNGARLIMSGLYESV
jgi:hypothetical protein